MVEILDTDGINGSITSICNNARKYLVVISPFLKINAKLRRSFETAVKRGVKLTFIYGKSELDKETLDWIKSLPYCNVGFIPDLHAKLLLNEEAALLSSMNLYEFSQVNNEELGMLAWVKDGKNEYKDLLYESIRLINTSVKQHGKWDLEDIDKPISGLLHKDSIFIPVDHIEPFTPEKVEEPKPEDPPKKQLCHCIRCGHVIPSYHNGVYCGRCYESWKQYSNVEYVERDGHCYICGKTCQVSAERPACPECYKLNSKLVNEKCRSMKASIDNIKSNED